MVFIGQDLDEGALRAALDACLLTEDDLDDRGDARRAAAGAEHSWKFGVDYLEDSIPRW